LAILAGAFIGFGGIYFTFSTTQTTISDSFTQIIGGVTFSLGLILVVIAGAELFTGNNLMLIPLMGKKISAVKLIRNWLIVYVGNFIGSVLIASLLYLTNMWSNKGGDFAIRAISIANHKVNLDFSNAFF
jgi:formate/nitrite transporter FocA (FNT family)